MAVTLAEGGTVLWWALRRLGRRLGSSDRAIREAAVRELVELDEPQAVRLLLEGPETTTDPWPVGEGVEAALAAGDEVCPHLLKHDRHPSAAARARIARVLGRMRTDSNTAQYTLEHLLTDSDAGVRAAALRALGRSRHERAFERLTREFWADLRDTPRRFVAAEALGESGDPRAVPLLLEAMAEPATAAADAGRVLPAALRQLGWTPSNLREKAILIVGRGGPADLITLRRLSADRDSFARDVRRVVAATCHPAGAVSDDAVAMLVSLGAPESPTRARLVAELVLLLHDPAWDAARPAVTRALAAAGWTPTTLMERVLHAAHADGDRADGLRRALDEVRQAGAAGAAAAEWLRQAARDEVGTPDYHLSPLERVCVEILAELGTPADSDRLLDVLAKARLVLDRDALLDAVCRIGDPKALVRLIAVADEMDGAEVFLRRNRERMPEDVLTLAMGLRNGSSRVTEWQSTSDGYYQSPVETGERGTIDHSAVRRPARKELDRRQKGNRRPPGDEPGGGCRFAGR